jgi:hypothetical protein
MVDRFEADESLRNLNFKLRTRSMEKIVDKRGENNYNIDEEVYRKCRFINDCNMKRASSQFTGQTILHWYKGEPQEEEQIARRKIL